MTIIEEDDAGGARYSSKKLSLLSKQPRKGGGKPDRRPLKRRGGKGEEAAPKRQALPGGLAMLNGYRSGGEPEQGCPVSTLSNMGNTCFLNSVIYTLRFAPTFLHNLHHLIGDLALVGARLNQQKAKSSSLGRNVSSATGPSARSTSSKDLLSLGSASADLLPKSKVQVVTEKLHELFMIMHNLELKESTDAYHPSAFLQAVRDANYIFEGNHQQDAHELLVYLLDNIRETCDLLAQQVQHNPELLAAEGDPQAGAGPNNSNFWSGVRCSWKKGNKKKEGRASAREAICEERAPNGVPDGEETASVDGGGNVSESCRKKLGYNFVAEDFEGITLRRTTCLECESVTERKEPFYDIPVPITFREEDFALTPNEIYRKACVTSEKLCDSNKYLCERCMRYNEASREVSFERLPNIMVLQLKRFTTTLAGVQKVSSYLPTPLNLACFCEGCCREEGGYPTHRYQLCCVIMHLGASMASGHYIAYVKATNHLEDYVDCPKSCGGGGGGAASKGTLSASSSEKSLNILKFLKPRAHGADLKNGVPSAKAANGTRVCKSVECCGVRLNKNVVENAVNSRTAGQNVWHPSIAADKDDVWLECDDETVKPISSQEFQEVLGCKPSSTSTPYLLFYNKVTDVLLDD